MWWVLNKCFAANSLKYVSAKKLKSSTVYLACKRNLTGQFGLSCYLTAEWCLCKQLAVHNNLSVVALRTNKQLSFAQRSVTDCELSLNDTVQD